jgi:uncharacterized protein (DUF2062 family)
MPKSVKKLRKPIIRKLLDQGTLTKKQIAESAGCTVGYVYQVSWDYELEKKIMEKNLQQMREISASIEQMSKKPTLFSDDWNPPFWKLLLTALPLAVVVYFVLVLVFSLN